jgi:hypothetical protein
MEHHCISTGERQFSVHAVPFSGTEKPEPQPKLPQIPRFTPLELAPEKGT